MNDNGGGIGFIGLLTLLFIGLKITGSIDWSWVWVLSPLWIPLVVVFILFLIGLMVVRDNQARRRRRRN